VAKRKYDERLDNLQQLLERAVVIEERTWRRVKRTTVALTVARSAIKSLRKRIVKRQEELDAPPPDPSALIV
jgi:hypothetical protein